MIEFKSEISMEKIGNLLIISKVSCELYAIAFCDYMKIMLKVFIPRYLIYALPRSSYSNVQLFESYTYFNLSPPLRIFPSLHLFHVLIQCLNSKLF